MLSFLCSDQRDWEEPGHLKFLNALQEDTGNNFSYLIPMNIVYGGGGRERGSAGGGDNLPRVKYPHHPTSTPHVCFNFYVMIKGIQKSLVIWSFWLPFKRMLETISPISSLKKVSRCGGGTIYPGVKCPPPPANPHVCFHVYVMIKGIEKSLVIWSFWMPFKRMLETISPISSLT